MIVPLVFAISLASCDVRQAVRPCAWPAHTKASCHAPTTSQQVGREKGSRRAQSAQATDSSRDPRSILQSSPDLCAFSHWGMCVSELSREERLGARPSCSDLAHVLCLVATGCSMRLRGAGSSDNEGGEGGTWNDSKSDEQGTAASCPGWSRAMLVGRDVRVPKGRGGVPHAAGTEGVQLPGDENWRQRGEKPSGSQPVDDSPDEEGAGYGLQEEAADPWDIRCLSQSKRLPVCMGGWWGGSNPALLHCQPLAVCVCASVCHGECLCGSMRGSVCLFVLCVRVCLCVKVSE